MQGVEKSNEGRRDDGARLSEPNAKEPDNESEAELRKKHDHPLPEGNSDGAVVQLINGKVNCIIEYNQYELVIL